MRSNLGNLQSNYVSELSVEHRGPRLAAAEPRCPAAQLNR